MATYEGSGDVSGRYPLGSGPRSSAYLPTKSSLAKTSLPEGYADTPTTWFTGITDLQKLVKSQSDDLLAGRTTQQFLIFQGVTKHCLDQIDRQRASIGKHTRITYYTDTGLFIIKLMPSKKHEAAHITLADEVNDKLRGMGLPKRSLYPLGAGRCFGSNSSKEGDSTYKPKCRPLEDDWPTIAFEAGLSESLAGLRTDARWWLTKSNGEVKIAIVISIVQERKSLLIEQWCMPLPLPVRLGSVIRARTSAITTANTTNTNATDPACIQTLTVIQDPPIPPLPGTIPTYTVTGAPLTLDFEKLLLRAPVLPEGNVVLTAADLQAWAEEFWSMFK